MQYEIPIEPEHLIVFSSGSVVIPSRYFKDIIRSLSNEWIQIETDDRLNVSIQSGMAKYALNGMDSQDFPQFVDHEQLNKVNIPSDLLKLLIQRVVFAISTSEARPALIGILEINQNTLKLSASDGIRLSTHNTHDCDKLIIKYSDKWKPLLIQPYDNINSLFLLTPIRTHN